MSPKPPYCPDPSEYPMNPSCAGTMISEAYSKNAKGASEATKVFFNEIAAAQKNFIAALEEILPDWKEPKEPKS